MSSEGDVVTVYREYTKARTGWFPFGLTGWQATVVAAASLPVFWALRVGAWAAAGGFALAGAAVVALTVVPVRGRSAIAWIATLAAYSVGGLTGWTRYRSAASRGQAGELAEVDLPGSLAGIEIHEGPPVGLTATRVAIIQNHATRTWAATAAVTHPGTGLHDANDRDRMGRGLADLLDQAARTELIDEILIVVRTVPDDGAERDQWTTRHRHPDGPPQARVINNDLQRALAGASVRTEAFVTIVVPETRLAKTARESGRGLAARAQVLYSLMGEVEAQLRGGLGAAGVTWLTSPQLAAAVRTGFAPGDRTSIIDALAAATTHPDIATGVPWALAGPSGADPVARHYSHDAWNSISATIKLPTRGAVLGALAPVLAPAGPGERRSFLVAYPILARAKAARATATNEWAADLGAGLRQRARIKATTAVTDAAAQVHALEAKQARGAAVARPYAVCTVTAPKTAPIAEHGRGLDASIRRAGFTPLRLDLAHDVAFAASVVPLGVSLTRSGDA